jgi:hypothetical protein
MQRQRLIFHPFYVDSVGLKFDAYDVRVDVAQAGALLDLAVFTSAAGWKSGAVHNAVAGTTVANVSVAASGNKTITLTTPVTLTEGYYSAMTLTHGGTADTTYWALADAAAYQGAGPTTGNAGLTSQVYAITFDAMPGSASTVATNVHNDGPYVCLRWAA